MAKGYWIVHVDVTDAENYPQYVALDTPIVEAHGGTFLVRGGTSETPETPMKDRHVVVEFPSYQAALECYHSAEYQAAAKIRVANAQSDVVIVEGVG